MKQNYTHVTFLLDRSGSMSSCWKDVVGGFKTLIEEQKKESGECTFSLIAFDNEYEFINNFEDIQSVSDELKVSPRGGTALLDALGKAIVETGEKLAAKSESERPEKTIFFLQSDGEENSSREFKKEKIVEMIKEQEEKYGWTFMFLGANMDAVNGVSQFGFNVNNSSTYNNAGSMTQGICGKMSQVRNMTLNAYMSGAASFTEEEREELNK